MPTTILMWKLNRQLNPIILLPTPSQKTDTLKMSLVRFFSEPFWLVYQGLMELFGLETCSFIALQQGNIPAGSPSRGGDVTVYVWRKPTELAHSFSFCSYAYFCLSGPFNCTSFHKLSQQFSIFSLCSSSLSSQAYWSFQVYISLWKSPSALI